MRKHQVWYIQSDIPINTCVGPKNAPFYENYQEKERGLMEKVVRIKLRYDTMRYDSRV